MLLQVNEASVVLEHGPVEIFADGSEGSFNGLELYIKYFIELLYLVIRKLHKFIMTLVNMSVKP